MNQVILELYRLLKDHYFKLVATGIISAVAWLATLLWPAVDRAATAYIRNAVLGKVSEQFSMYAGQGATDFARSESSREFLEKNIPLRIARALLPGADIKGNVSITSLQPVDFVRQSIGLPPGGARSDSLINVLKIQRDTFLDNIAGSVHLNVALIEFPVTKLSSGRMERFPGRSASVRPFGPHELTGAGVPVCGAALSESASMQEYEKDIRFAMMVPKYRSGASNAARTPKSYFLYHMIYPASQLAIRQSQVPWGPPIHLELLDRNEGSATTDNTKQRRKRLPHTGAEGAHAIEITDLMELATGGPSIDSEVPSEDVQRGGITDFRRSIFVFRFCFERQDIERTITEAASCLMAPGCLEQVARASVSYAAVVGRHIDTTNLDGLVNHQSLRK